MRRERERDRKRETKREKEQEQEEDAKGTKVRYRGAATTNEHEYWYCTVWIVIVHRRVDGTHGRKKEENAQLSRWGMTIGGACRVHQRPRHSKIRESLAPYHFGPADG